MRVIEFKKNHPRSHTKEHEWKGLRDVPPSCFFVWLRGWTFLSIPGLALLMMLAAVRADADDPRLVIDPGGHTAVIRQILFTRDGKFLVSAGDDKVIRIWDPATGKTVRTIQGETGEGNEGKIYAMALSPDNQVLAVGGWLAGTQENICAIRLHDFNTGEMIGLLPGHENIVDSLDFSPDGRYLASGSQDKTVRIWDVARDRMKQAFLLAEHSDRVKDVAFSPDGKLIASGSWDKTLILWDAVRGQKIREMKKRHGDRVRSVAFSPDGRYLVSGGDDKRVLLWDGQTGNFIKELYKQDTSVADLSFSPDGARLLTGWGSSGGNVCHVLAVPSGKVIARFDLHKNVILATAFSPDGKRVATGGGSNNEIHLWNPDNGQIIRTLAGKGQPVWSVGFARDGQSIAYGLKVDQKGINERGPLQQALTLKSGGLYNVGLGGDVKSEADYFRAIESQGEFALKTTRDRDPALQVLKSGTPHKTIVRDSTSGVSHRSYTFTRDGRRIVSGGANGVLTLYETQTGQQVRQFTGHTGDVWSVAVSPDNQLLVSGSHDQTVRLWEIATGKNLLSFFIAGDNEWIAWTPDGYYASSLNGDRYIGWHVNRGIEKQAGYYAAAQFKDRYRPDVVAEYLRTQDFQLALKAANEKLGKAFTAQLNAATPNIADSYPPVVFIAAPEKDESDNEMVMVRAEAKPIPNTPPVSDLKVLLNGVQVGSANGSRWEGQVRLQPGMNTLAVIAANERAVSEPEVKKITYTGRGAATAKPNLVLLAIGIKSYQDKGLSLGFADQDALKMAAMFKAQEGVLFNRVHVETITNEQVTREEMIDKLDWLNKTSSQNDVVVLFLSGHGSLYKGNYYFWTHKHDPQGNPEKFDVKWSTLIDGLTAVPGTKPILFVDSCRAAAAAGARRKGDEGLTEALKDLKQNYQGVVFFAASKDNEDSIEIDSLGHGAFTYSLLDGLKGNADTTRDQVVYIDELGNWVRDQVRKLTGGKQHAVYKEPEGTGFQPFPIFALPKR